MPPRTDLQPPQPLNSALQRRINQGGIRLYFRLRKLKSLRARGWLALSLAARVSHEFTGNAGIKRQDAPFRTQDPARDGNYIGKLRHDAHVTSHDTHGFAFAP